MSYQITYDEDGEGNSVLRYSGDAQGLVDACAKEARANREVGRRVRSDSANMRRTMSLDPIVMMMIAQEHGIPYWDIDAIFEKARGRDYSKFRMVDDKTLFRDRSKLIIGA